VSATRERGLLSALPAPKLEPSRVTLAAPVEGPLAPETELGCEEYDSADVCDATWTPTLMALAAVAPTPAGLLLSTAVIETQPVLSECERPTAPARE
jgi:hypothetical protein